MPGKIEKAVFTSVEVLRSSCKPVQVTGNYRESIFHHCVCAVNLALACLSTKRHREGSFHHCGSSVKLVKACLCARKDREQFSAMWWSCPARGSLFKCQERSRKQF